MFFDRHQFQMVALALRMDGEVSCLRERDREARSDEEGVELRRGRIKNRG